MERLLSEKRHLWEVVAVSALFIMLVFATAPALAGMKVGEWTGSVQHVSTNNIKVYSWKQHHSLSFLLLPHFDRVFFEDGKTTYQMARIKTGMIVKVYYDQRAFGARHADRILVLGGNNLPSINMKS